MPCFVPLGSYVFLFSTEIPRKTMADRTFTENFGTLFDQSIREKNEIQVQIASVSVEDIAQAAYDALVSEKSLNKDYFIVGPELSRGE
jgi:uncharacterized protein YbjT (DUF2867 family)